MIQIFLAGRSSEVVQEGLADLKNKQRFRWSHYFWNHFPTLCTGNPLSQFSAVDTSKASFPSIQAAGAGKHSTFQNRVVQVKSRKKTFQALMMWNVESTLWIQRRKNLGSIATRNGLRVWKVFARITERYLLNCPNSFKTVQMISHFLDGVR